MSKFNEKIDRKGSYSLKWDDVVQWFDSDEVLPMWVADMDFRCPQEVVEAVKARVDHGIFGYSGNLDHYYDAVVNWLKLEQRWEIKKDWICITEGVVAAVNMLIQALSNEGDKVLIQTPVYPPFFKAINNNNRVLVENQLVYKDGRYGIDFEALGKELDGVKIFLLCSPHNPVGRVWTREELQKIGELAQKHGVTIISDEIHGDLTFKDQKFVSMGLIESSNGNLAVCTAPSKAFNIAGLHTSNIIIPDSKLRNEFQKVLDRNGVATKPNVLAMVALIAAYNHGQNWLDEVMEYIEGNFSYLDEYLKENILKIKLVEAEGTYLAWLDCSALGLRAIELSDFFTKECKVGVVPGYSFGKGGEHFVRLNLGCSRFLLEEALDRINNAVKKRF